MQHVDEERLNAWLDFGRSGMGRAEYAQIGSHLARCAECSALLAEERALRERASSILGAGVPRSSARPSFEELVARSAGTSQTGGTPQAGGAGSTRAAGSAARTQNTGASPGSRRVRPGFVPLAWAASVMAALGLGWAASTLSDRDQVAIEMSSPAAQEAAVSSIAEAPTASVESVEEQASTMATAEPTAPVPVDAATSRSGAPAAGAIAAASPQPVAASSAARIGEPAGEADEPVALKLDELTVVGYGNQSRATVSGAVQAESARAAGPLNATDAFGDSGAGAPLSLTGQAAVEETPAARTIPAAPPTAPPAAAPAAASAPPPPIIGTPGPGIASALVQPGIVWSIVDRDAAEERLGSALAIHPVLPLLRFEVPTNSPTNAARTVYALPDGSHLTVTHVRAVAGDAAQSQSAASATVRRGDQLLIGTGLISADSIRAILEELR